MFMPNSGRLVRTSGNTAQCMAQTTEVAIPKASQLTCSFMIKANILSRNQVAKFIFATLHFWSVSLIKTNFVFKFYYEQKNYILCHFFFITCSCILCRSDQCNSWF